MTNNRAYEYTCNILFWYLWHFFQFTTWFHTDFEAPQGGHYFAFFWAAGYKAQLYRLSLAKPRNKSRMRYPWNLIRWCPFHLMSHQFFEGKYLEKKRGNLHLYGVKSKKTVESTASSATSGVLEGDVWEVSFPSWGMCYGRSNSSHFTIIGQMFICLFVVVCSGWVWLILILFLAFTLWSLWHPRMALPIFWGTEQP